MIRTAVEAGMRWVWGASTRGAVLAGRGLAPLETAFSAAVAVRNRRYELGRSAVESAGVPVVSVGNLAVGGTGKTPFAAWLAAWYQRRGVPAGIVTNGYGRDEVLLHRHWNPGVPVAAGRRRARAAEAVVEQGARVVILDDGFQHRGLARDLDLVLVAAEHPMPARLLPRGPYREPETALRRAHAVIVTRRSAGFREARRRAAKLAAAHGLSPVVAGITISGWRDLQGDPVAAPDGSVLAVSGIADPREFRGLLERESPAVEVESMAFGDHHAYSDSDLAAIARRARGRGVVTTAKDAVKLGGLMELGVDTRVLHLEVEIEEGEQWLEQALLAQLPGDSENMVSEKPAGSGRAATRITARERGSGPAKWRTRAGRVPHGRARGTVR